MNKVEQRYMLTKLYILMGFAAKSKDPEALRLIRELYHVMNIARKKY